MKDEYLRILNETNAVIYFDENNYLRETAADLSLLVKGIEALEGLLSAASDSERYILFGALGNFYRIYGNEDLTQLAKAKYYLDYCLEYAIKQEDTVKKIITLIRLGEAYKYEEEHIKALVLFNEALDLCRIPNFVVFEDFALQHIGKCYMEMNNIDCAERHLQEALELRRQKGDKTLISSTEKAIELLRVLKKNQ